MPVVVKPACFFAVVRRRKDDIRKRRELNERAIRDGTSYTIAMINTHRHTNNDHRRDEIEREAGERRLGLTGTYRPTAAVARDATPYFDADDEIYDGAGCGATKQEENGFVCGFPPRFSRLIPCFRHVLYAADVDALRFTRSSEIARRLRLTDADIDLVIAAATEWIPVARDATSSEREERAARADACVLAGASETAQHVAFARSCFSPDLFARLPALYADRSAILAWRTFLLRKQACRNWFPFVGPDGRETVRQDVCRLLDEETDEATRFSPLRGTDVLQHALSFDDGGATFRRILEGGVEKFEANRALLRAAEIHDDKAVAALLSPTPSRSCSFASSDLSQTSAAVETVVAADPDARDVLYGRSRDDRRDFQLRPLTMVCSQKSRNGGTGETPAQLNAAQLLIDAGASVDDHDGAALAYALKLRSFRLARLLRDRGGANVWTSRVVRSALSSVEGTRFLMETVSPPCPPAQ